jgi:CheY-like chemotaxis protein
MSGPSRPARLLLVDDNDDDIALMRLAFRRAGTNCSVAAAAGGDAALAHLASPTEPRPDLVLLDWRMPGTSGLEVLRTIRADPRLLGLPVVVFSSSDDPEDVKDAYAAGATCYLTKPPGLSEYEALAHKLHSFWCCGVQLPER